MMFGLVRRWTRTSPAHSGTLQEKMHGPVSSISELGDALG
jgi:hypothetical protein